jgi:MoxR-like ATPase
MRQGVSMEMENAELFRSAENIDALRRVLRTVIAGRGESLEMAVVCLVAGGHLLLEDVPGVGKTLLAKTLSRAIDGTMGRVQMTPDVLPSDITGSLVYDQLLQSFEFRPGPVFANVVLVDEINRATAKTQSALLEVMAEGSVTIDGEPQFVPRPFCVIATQNPPSSVGTFPLPDVQLDRFLMRISLGYPDRASEVEILRREHFGRALPQCDPVLTDVSLSLMQKSAREIFASEALLGYIVEIVAASRRHPEVAVGWSPRASLALLSAARAHALMRHRLFVLPEDIHRVAVPVLAHRLVPVQPDNPTIAIVEKIIGSVEVPPGTGEP